MIVILGVIAALLLLAAVFPMPVVHSALAWIATALGQAINHLAAQGLASLASNPALGHPTQWAQLVASTIAVLGLGLVVVALAVVSTAKAAARGAVLLVLGGIFLFSGAYVTTGIGRLTFWVAAALCAFVFVGVLVFGRLVAVAATVIVGASALTTLLDIHGAISTKSANSLASLSRFHDPMVWGLALTGLGLLELCVAARIMLSGKVWLSPPGGTTSE
jgi:hypothetical protein